MWSVKQHKGYKNEYDEPYLYVPQLVSYPNDNGTTTHLLFGAYDDGNIYSFDPITSTFSLFDTYPNTFTPYFHNIQLYYNKNSKSYHVLSFGGDYDDQHFYSYNINTKQWKNIYQKINKNKIYINRGSKSSLGYNNNNVIITTQEEYGNNNIIYIYSLYDEKIIKQIKKNEMSFLNNIKLEYHGFISVDNNNDFLIFKNNNMYKIHLNNNYNIKCIKNIKLNLFKKKFEKFNYTKIKTNKMKT